jgi:hypothetical protein
MYKFYEDPGHGWLKVPRKELVELGIENEISPYSYMSGSGRMVYLEEDSDLSKFARAKGFVPGSGSWSDFAALLGGIEKVYHEDNRVRGLPSYSKGL